MPDSGASPQPKADWSGTIIAASVAPVFIVFVYLGKPELGFTVCIVLGMTILAVKLRWPLRRYAWFWVTTASALAVQVPFLALVHWPTTNVPMRVIAFPAGVAEFLVVSGAISLAKMVFLKGDAPSDRVEQQ